MVSAANDMRKRKATFIVLLLLGVGLVLGARSYMREDQPQGAYQTAVVERGPLLRLVTATGTVNPVSTVQVGSYVSGPIKELFVDFNSPVRQGQRVAQIDPRLFLVKVKQAEATLVTARARVEKDNADLLFKQQVLKRTRSLPSDIRFDPAQFLQIPACVFVGERDIRRSHSLNQSRRVDQQQGLSRLERGEHWINAMTNAAARYHFHTPYTLHVLPRSGHSFIHSMKRGGMGQRVFEFLFGPPPAEHSRAAA